MKRLTSLRAHAGSTRSSCIPGLATAAKAASYRCDLTAFPALELPGSARFQIGLGDATSLMRTRVPSSRQSLQASEALQLSRAVPRPLSASPS